MGMRLLPEVHMPPTDRFWTWLAVYVAVSLGSYAALLAIMIG